MDIKKIIPVMAIAIFGTSNYEKTVQAQDNDPTVVTQNTVVVKNTDNVIFEAASEVTLNPGFEVKSGGAFEINMNGCGEK